MTAKAPFHHPSFGAILRTDDTAFSDLPDWPYDPCYIDQLPSYKDMRCHYVDEGPRDAENLFLCIHGEPSWAYLFRHMIPEFTAAGGRVIAPDMFGFGRSDKPKDDAVYTYGFHRRMLIDFIEALDLKNITLVCQDWGGILGLSLPMEMPDRFKRLIVMNTGLPIGTAPSEGFIAWRDFVATNPEFNVAGLMKRSTPKMTDAEAAAYGAPFPTPDYMAGVRRFPQLVQTAPDMEGVDINKRAIDFWSTQWQGQSFMAIGMQDPVLGPPVMHMMAKMIRNCPAPLEVDEAGHFVQEWGGPIANAALKHFGDIAC